MDKFLRNRSTLNPGRGEFLPTLTFAPLPFFHFSVSDGKHPRREHLETTLKRFASRLNFQFDSINTRLESRFWKFTFYSFYAQRLASTKIVYNRATSRNIVSRYNFDNREFESLSYSHGRTASTRFYRITFPELQRGERGFSGSEPVPRRSRPAEEGRIKARKMKKTISRIQTRDEEDNARIRGEIRGIPNPVTSWTDMVDDSLTDPSGFNH